MPLAQEISLKVIQKRQIENKRNLHIRDLVKNCKTLKIVSLCADSSVSAEEPKGEESSLQSLHNSDQFCVVSSQILWNRLGFAAQFTVTVVLTCVQLILHVTIFQHLLQAEEAEHK